MKHRFDAEGGEKMSAKFCIVDCEQKLYLGQPGIVFTASADKALLFSKFSGATSHMKNVQRSSSLSQYGVRPKNLRVIQETDAIPGINEPATEVSVPKEIKRCHVESPKKVYISMTEYFPDSEPGRLLGESIDAINLLAELYPNWDNMLKVFEDGEKLAEDKVCDIYHKIEFTKAGAVEGYKLYKTLHDALIERRKMKDAVMFLTALSSTSAKYLVDSYRNAEKSFTNRVYAPRAMPELFQESA